MTSEFTLFKINKSQKTLFYVVAEKHQCSVCNKSIEEPICIYIFDWTKRGLFKHLLHSNCAKKFVPDVLSVVPERNTARLAYEAPFGSVLVTPRFPSVIARNKGEVSTDWISIIDKPSDSVEDRTVYAFTQESLEGAIVGDPLIEEKLQEKDKKLSFDDGLSLLDDLKAESVLTIAEQKKGLLEDAENAEKKSERRT